MDWNYACAIYFITKLLNAAELFVVLHVLLWDFQKWHYQVSQGLAAKRLTSFLEVTFCKNI